MNIKLTLCLAISATIGSGLANAMSDTPTSTSEVIVTAPAVPV